MANRPHYKYYLGLTSQINFCQVPLRLDAYNQCAFSCSYCFAKLRNGHRGPRKLQVLRAKPLDERFRRIEDGNLSSAVDEFIQRRIPIQFGGMTDPFSDFEERYGSSLDLLKVLANRGYPTLLSTKSPLLGRQDYAHVLAQGNFLVRFSVSVVPTRERVQIESGMPTPKSVFRAVEILAKQNVHCGIRFQPIVPTYEDEGFRLTTRAKDAGAKHVTYEYLKLPSDRISKIAACPTRMGTSLFDFYRSLGANRQGREFILPLAYRMTFLTEIAEFARCLGLTVGFGDNELLPFGDGSSCCNAADLYLKEARLFLANPASVIRRKKKGEDIALNELLGEWTPSQSVNTYLNSKVRSKRTKNGNDWHNYLKEHWRVGAIYAPDFFHGVEFRGRFDTEGFPIFTRTETNLRAASQLEVTMLQRPHPT